MIKTLISKDQIGFVKGRNIASHLGLFDDLAKFLNKTNGIGALIILDFSKVFDTLFK